MEAIKTKNIFLIFLRWYFFEAPKKILAIWRNFLIAFWRYFSIGLLLKTLLAPWKRDVAKRPAGFDFKIFFETLIINLFTRCLGAIIRSVVIILGLVFELVILILGLIFFIGWLIWPFISIIGIYYSVKFLLP